MKRQAFRFITPIFLFVFTWSFVIAKPDYEERKQVNKSYQVGSTTSVSFINSFGRLHINTWDKNDLQVNIEIIARSSSETKAKEMLDRIKIIIEDGSPMSSVSFKTSITDSRSGGNNSFEINYTVNMPKNNTLYLKNSFGDAYLADYSGKVTINESYGNLKAENLDGESDIDLSFGGGTSTITSIKKGSLKVGYSNIEVGLIGQAEVNTQFSNIEIGKGVDINLVSKYGDVKLGEINNIEATVNFASFELEKLEKKIILDIDYGGKTEIKQISKNLQLLDIDSSFGPVKINLPAELNANIRVHVEFGNMDFDSGKINFNKIHEGQTSRDYEGRMGAGSANVNIQIDAKYGDVRISQD